MSAFDRFFATLFDEQDISGDRRNVFAHPYISDCLPWRAYDAEKGVYHNTGTSGFILGFAGAGVEDFDERFHAVLTQQGQEGMTVQFLNWTSPDLDPVLGPWQRARSGRAGDEALAKARRGFLSARVDGMPGTHKTVPHVRRFFLVISMEEEAFAKDWLQVHELRDVLLEFLRLNGDAWTVKPPEFLSFIAEVLRCGKGQGDVVPWSEDEALNCQIPGSSLRVEPRCIVVEEGNQFAACGGTVRAFPQKWSFAQGLSLLGDFQRSDQRVNGPTLVSFIARMIPRREAAADMRTRSAKLAHGQATGWGRLNKTSQGKVDEISALADEVEAGESLFETVFSVIQFTSGGERAAVAEFQRIAAVYRRMGLKLELDEHLQLPVLLGSLPFCADKAALDDMKRAQRMRILKGAAICTLAPVHGEIVLPSAPTGMVCNGPLGQLFTFDPFASSTNYNVAVVGKSGAGKSVLMQDLCVALHGGGAKVVVIDDGYSFEKTVEVLGGSLTAFEEGRGVSVNPFSLLNAQAMQDPDYRGEAIQMITAVVASMADLSASSAGRVQNIEEEFISHAVEEVWEERGSAGEITEVREKLRARAEDEERLVDIVGKLERYCRGGLYGSYFEGPATLSANGEFIVFEMSTIKTKRGLAPVVMQIVMFLASELMFRTSREQRVALVIDEAWSMLADDSTAAFIEGLVRRVRKYNGSLITGTQSLSDYDGNASARICKENSSWLLIMGQEADTLERYREILSVSDGQLEKLKRVNSVRGAYSEFILRTERMFIAGRLVLDPTHLLMFSTNGAVTERYRQHRKLGKSPVAAVQELVREGLKP